MARRAERRRGGGAPAPKRKVNYHQLRNPFPRQNAFSDDQISAMHAAALDLLETEGMDVLLPEAVELYRAAGAVVDGQKVKLGREIVLAALETAPKSFDLKAINPKYDQKVELGTLIFQPGAAAPHVTDLDRGRRPGSISDYIECVKLMQGFDVLHLIAPMTEPQDVDTSLRHYAMLDAHFAHSDKIPFLYSRGTPQVMDGFEMLRDFKGLSDAAFQADPHVYSIINTNSPKVLDKPMAQGLIDFARNGQMTIVTPFTLMGAMAPITVGGAILLSHMEALSAITLTQLAKPGAPVCYGTFTSAVHMKSGSPTFGTPEHYRASLAAGQLARLIGLPWRCAAGSASNVNDVQAANENQFGLWGCLAAGATHIIHSAGWLEGGLTVSLEKMVSDVEVLNMVAELCNSFDQDIAKDAIREVRNAGHFFDSPHTMARYKEAFYEPILHKFDNFGTWTERGAKDASARATEVWKEKLATFTPPPVDQDRLDAFRADVAKRTEQGGSPPES